MHPAVRYAASSVVLVSLAGAPAFADSATAPRAIVARYVSPPATPIARYLGLDTVDWNHRSQKLGEAGVELFAKENNIRLLPDLSERIPQGPDRIGVMTDGTVVAIEAKGPHSTLKTSFGGLKQGSVDHAIASANNVLTHPHAPSAQQAQCALLMDAAMEGKLKSRVIRTPIDHFGRPMSPSPEFSGNSTEATQQLAKTLHDNYQRRRPEFSRKARGGTERGGSRGN